MRHQSWREYETQVKSKDRKTNERLKKSYVEAMEITMKASDLLEKEIKAKLIEAIDKASFTNKRPTGGPPKPKTQTQLPRHPKRQR